MTVPPSVPTYDPSEPVEAPPVSGVVGRSSGDAAGEWLERNGRALGIAGLVAALAVAGGYAYRASSRASAERADRSLYEAEARYAQGDPSATQALQQVTSRYGDTPAGAHARALLAQAYYDQGKYAQGLQVLGTGSAPADWRESTERLRAAGLEGSGRYKDAAAAYEQLAGTASPDAKSSLLAEAARVYGEGGDVANARRLWQQLIDAGSRGGVADEARVRLGELEAKAP